MFTKGFEKLSFGGVDPVSGGTIGGILSGYGTGRSAAGVTSHALSAKGHKTKNEETSRTLAKGTGIAGALAGLGLGFKHKAKIIGQLNKRFGNHPEMQAVYHGLVPFLAGTLGGASAGAGTGALVSLRGRLGRKKTRGEKVMFTKGFKKQAQEAGTVQRATQTVTPNHPGYNAKNMAAMQAGAQKTVSFIDTAKKNLDPSKWW